MSKIFDILEMSNFLTYLITVYTVISKNFDIKNSPKKSPKKLFDILEMSKNFDISILWTNARVFTIIKNFCDYEKLFDIS